MQSHACWPIPICRYWSLKILVSVLTIDSESQGITFHRHCYTGQILCQYFCCYCWESCCVSVRGFTLFLTEARCVYIAECKNICSSTHSIHSSKLYVVFPDKRPDSSLGNVIALHFLGSSHIQRSHHTQNIQEGALHYHFEKMYVLRLDWYLCTIAHAYPKTFYVYEFQQFD